MSSRLYVRNLASSTTHAVLRYAFSQWGEVLDTKIVSDRITGHQRGFAFVTMATSEAAKAALAHMHGAYLEGHLLRVNEVREPQSRLH